MDATIYRQMTFVASTCILLALIVPANTGVVSTGYVDVVRRDLGDLTITVWQIPADPVVGQIQFGVEVVETSTAQPVKRALVKIYATPPYEGERLVATAISTPAAPQFYEALFSLNSTGIWGVEVVIAEYGDIDFTVAVSPRLRSGSNTFWASTLFYVVQGIFVVALVLLIMHSRRRVRRSRD